MFIVDHQTELIRFQNIKSLVSFIFDGWTTKRRRPFTSVSIQYIHSPDNDPYDWSLRSHLLAFQRTVGRHTGANLGQELVDVAKRYRLENLVSFLIGDNVNANNVAVRHYCKMIDPTRKRLKAKTARGRSVAFHPPS